MDEASTKAVFFNKGEDGDVQEFPKVMRGEAFGAGEEEGRMKGEEKKDTLYSLWAPECESDSLTV